MNDDQLRELGVPRRRFLKTATAAAFAAPVVASFGMEGVASADPVMLNPNQVVSVDNDLLAVINLAFSAAERGAITSGQLTSIAKQALGAALAAVDGNQRSVCSKISGLVATLQSVLHQNDLAPNSDVGLALVHATRAQAAGGCTA